MKCKIISVSHKPSDWEKKAIQFYSKQLPNHFQISSVEVKPSSSKSMTNASILEAEGDGIVKHIDKDAHIILWDRRGSRINSLDFANLIQDKADIGQNINFIIGGAHGSSDKLFKKAQLILSASNLTFPHRLFKIFLIEQIYRASAINRNHPYHK
tara:strand:- start:2566 stop:3030 length:465 start_codon:yes stop_codon:yes gene_type:complete